MQLNVTYSRSLRASVKYQTLKTEKATFICVYLMYKVQNNKCNLEKYKIINEEKLIFEILLLRISLRYC